MRWTNHPSQTFSQSHDFSKSGFAPSSRFGSARQYDLSSQKNLIYDLRSELSSLKCEFSRLISKPEDKGPKPKAVAQQTTSQTSSNPSTNFANSGSNEHQNTPNGTYGHSNKAYKNIQNVPMGTPKVHRNHSRSSSSYTSSERPVVEIGNSSNYITPSHTYAVNPADDRTTRTEDRVQQYSERLGQERASKRPDENKNQQVFTSYSQQQPYQEKIDYSRQISLLSDKIKDLEQQISLKDKQNVEQNKEIINLKQLLSKSEETNKLQYKKWTEEQQLLKAQMMSQMETQRNNITTKLEGQKKIALDETIANLSKGFEQKMGRIRQKYERQLQTQSQQFKGVLEEQTMNIVKKLESQEGIIEQLHKALAQKDDIIQNISDRQRQLQEHTEQLLAQRRRQEQSRPILMEIGLNTERPAEDPVGEGEQKLKQLQDKVSVYLSSIDKQNSKIKVLKQQLEASEAKLQGCEQFIVEKENIIHSLLQDLKNLEKDLNCMQSSNRRMEELLDVSNQEIMRQGLKLLNMKLGASSEMD